MNLQQNFLNLKKVIFYLAIMGAFTLLIFFILKKGSALEEGITSLSVPSGNGDWAQFLDSLIHNFEHPLAILLAQIAAIIIVARFFGYIFSKIGQPTVVGEIIAGIVLGPSLLGKYFPEFSGALFPTESLGNLQFLKPDRLDPLHVCDWDGIGFKSA